MSDEEDIAGPHDPEKSNLSSSTLGWDTKDVQSPARKHYERSELLALRPLAVQNIRVPSLKELGVVYPPVKGAYISPQRPSSGIIGSHNYRGINSPKAAVDSTKPTVQLRKSFANNNENQPSYSDPQQESFEVWAWGEDNGRAPSPYFSPKPMTNFGASPQGGAIKGEAYVKVPNSGQQLADASSLSRFEPSQGHPSKTSHLPALPVLEPSPKDAAQDLLEFDNSFLEIAPLRPGKWHGKDENGQPILDFDNSELDAFAEMVDKNRRTPDARTRPAQDSWTNDLKQVDGILVDLGSSGEQQRSSPSAATQPASAPVTPRYDMQPSKQVERRLNSELMHTVSPHGNMPAWANVGSPTNSRATSTVTRALKLDTFHLTKAQRSERTWAQFKADLSAWAAPRTREDVKLMMSQEFPLEEVIVNAGMNNRFEKELEEVLALEDSMR
ncbi:MAG: hypothetical protein Q9162_001784 [Coniocarpon cinnabarinum]